MPAAPGSSSNGRRTPWRTRGRRTSRGITVPRALTPVQDGDHVFDLQIVTTPGHTAGSISVLDPAGSVLVAGDALRVTDGRPAYPDGQFTEDMEGAKASVAQLAGLAFDTLLVGHGDPIEGGAAAAVAARGGRVTDCNARETADP